MLDSYERKGSGFKWGVLPLFFIFLLVCSVSVFAQANPQSVGDVSIIYPKTLVYKAGENFSFSFDTLNNDSIKLSDNNISCSFSSFNSQGEIVSSGFASYVSESKIWVYVVSESDSVVGNYDFYIYCNNSFYGASSGSFHVTSDGKIFSFKSLIYLLVFFVIGLSLFLVGRVFKDYTVGIIGGLFIFLTGLFVLINPLQNLSSWFNFAIGSVIWCWGAYIWIVGTLEAIDLR